jgi:predicted DCC family thiol-disulfide oxidoreductase YuxK
MTVRRSGANSARQMDRVLIYDGECRFCIGQAATVARLLRPCALESFREPGVLERYPGITEEACGQAVQLVLKSEGRVLNGAAAVAYALRRKPLLAPFGWLYLVPGFRRVYDVGYREIARNRLLLGGRVCDGQRCGVR